MNLKNLFPKLKEILIKKLNLKKTSDSIELNRTSKNQTVTIISDNQVISFNEFAYLHVSTDENLGLIYVGDDEVFELPNNATLMLAYKSIADAKLSILSWNAHVPVIDIRIENIIQTEDLPF